MPTKSPRSAREVIAANPKQVEQYRSGKTATLGWLVGQVMKATRGQANPQMVQELLKKELARQMSVQPHVHAMDSLQTPRVFGKPDAQYKRGITYAQGWRHGSGFLLAVRLGR